MKLVLAVLATKLEPWDETIQSHQKPAFLGQKTPDSAPYWLYATGARGSHGKQFDLQDARLLRDRYNDYLHRIFGFRAVRRNPNKSSKAFGKLLDELYTGSKIQSEDFCCSIPDGLSTLGFRTLAFMEYLLDHDDFEFMFRTNTSSFVHFNRLLELVDRMPTGSPIYGGFPVRMGNLYFASGAGILLNRRAVELLMKSRRSYDFSYLDDQAVGLQMRRLHGVPITPLSRATFTQKVSSRGPLEILEGERIDRPDLFHWRCKSDDPKVERERIDYLARLFSS